MSDNNTGDSQSNNSGSNLTRRSLMALAGATGLGLASTGTATASSDYLQIDGGNAMTADLDVGGNHITNVSDISLEGHITPPESQNWSSYNTSGSGNGNVQIGVATRTRGRSTSGQLRVQLRTTLRKPTASQER